MIVQIQKGGKFRPKLKYKLELIYINCKYCSGQNAHKELRYICKDY